MDLEAIFIYCLCADTFNALNIKDDHQCKMNCAEIATFVIISALHYQCNYRKTRLVMLSHGYFSNVLIPFIENNFVNLPSFTAIF